MKNDKSFRSDDFTSGPAQFLPFRNEPLWKTRLEAIGIILLLVTIAFLSIIGLVTIVNWLL